MHLDSLAWGICFLKNSFNLIIVSFSIIFLFLQPSKELYAQQPAAGMSRNGTIGIQNETERKLFSSLICMCGCPREALSTCTCDYAAERRHELREQLGQGKSIEEIQQNYVKQFGLSGLTVPPNKGGNQFVWIIPLLAISLGMGLVAFLFAKWGKRGETISEKEDGRKSSSKEDIDDEYDGKLDLALNQDNDEGK